MNNTELESRIVKIELVDKDEAGRVGLVDVRFRVYVGDNKHRNPQGALDVRVYFTDNSMTLEQAKTEAVARAMEICKLVGSFETPVPPKSDFHQRWK